MRAAALVIARWVHAADGCRKAPQVVVSEATTYALDGRESEDACGWFSGATVISRLWQPANVSRDVMQPVQNKPASRSLFESRLFPETGGM
jgi:hypothetical protein